MTKLVDLYEEGPITNEDKVKVFEAAQAFYKRAVWNTVEQDFGFMQ